MSTAGQELDEENPSRGLLEFRYKLLVEEVTEVGEEVAMAMAERSLGNPIPHKVMVRLLKELADVQYVLSGFSEALGLDLETAFNRVHASNMSKFVDGKALFNDHGKVMKGPNYQPPNLEDLVKEVD